MTRPLWLIVAAVFIGLAASALAANPFRLPKVQPRAVEVITAREPGLLETLEVALGDEVKANAIVGKLDHERQLFAQMAAKMRSENTAQIDAAQGELREKNATLSETMTRFRKRQASEEDVERAQGQAQVARAKLAQARLNQEIAKLELALAERLLENRYLRSPISGTVVEISKPRGSRLNQGDPVLTVADQSVLTADFLVAKEALDSLSVGSSVPIRIPGSESLRYAKVQSLEPAPESKTGQYRASLLFENLSPEVPLAAQTLEILLPESARPQPIPPAPTPQPQKK